MSTSRAFTIAAIAGTVLLIPVIVILALGVYGSSITGDFPLAEDRGPTLRVEPPSGAAGSDITIRGADWVPRTLVRLEIVAAASRPVLTAEGVIDTVSTQSPAVFVGEVLVSRAGTFTIETQLPATLPLTAQSSVDLRASASYRGGESAGSAATVFDVTAGPGAIQATVVDAATGQALTRGVVELLSDRGDLLAAAPVAVDGTAGFRGLSTATSYDVQARVPGFSVLRSRGVTVAEDEPSTVHFQMPAGDPGRILVGGVPAAGASVPFSMAVIDLPSLAPAPPVDLRTLPASWAIAADPARGRAFAVDEVATSVAVIDPGGGLVASIPIAFDLVVRVEDSEGAPVPEAMVRLFWNARGQRVFVRAARTGDDGRVRVEHLISGSSYDIFASAAGYFQPLGARVTAVIQPNAASTATVVLRADSSQRAPRSTLAPLPGAARAPATALVTSDIAVDPANGRVYLTGSDLDGGHLFVLDPEARRIIHDWPVPAGVGDVAPAGDGATVYLANRPFSTVARFNVLTGETELSMPVPSWPESLARDSSGRLFVASLRDGSVSQLDPASLTVLRSRRLEEGVHRLAIDERTDTVIVSNIWADTVTGLRADDLTIRFLIPVAASPRAVALDPVGGSLIVASADQGAVAVYSPETFELRQSLELHIPINDVAVIPAPQGAAPAAPPTPPAAQSAAAPPAASSASSAARPAAPSAA